jgi:hypothetical protein
MPPGRLKKIRCHEALYRFRIGVGVGVGELVGLVINLDDNRLLGQGRPGRPCMIAHMDLRLQVNDELLEALSVLGVPEG